MAFDQAAKTFASDTVDAETLETFLHECAAIADAHSHNADACRILSALGQPEVMEINRGGLSLNLINDYNALHPQYRLALEETLIHLSVASEGITAVSIFDAMAVVANSRILERESDDTDLVITYLKEVADCWRRHGLRPGRMQQVPTEQLKLKHNHRYKGAFHRFAELVLIYRLHPESRTFEPLDNEIEQVANLIANEKEERKILVPLRHHDLISD